MKRVLVAGIGNVLLGDDGVGPFVAQWLSASYSFAEGVEVEDLGTPALDFIDRIVGLDALIVVDAVNNDQPAGTVTLYCKEDLLRNAPGVRMDTHSPALSESLLAAEVFFGLSPKAVLLVGISGASYQAECALSKPVRAAVMSATTAVLAELTRMGVAYSVKKPATIPETWSPAPTAVFDPLTHCS
jgi:hydrogenase maturation protease